MSTPYSVTYTIEAAEARRQLDEIRLKSLDEMMAVIAVDPYRKSNSLLGDSTLRQALTPDNVCVTYKVIDEFTIVVGLAVNYFEK